MLFKGKPIQDSDGILLHTHLALLQKPYEGERDGFREAASIVCQELEEFGLCRFPIVVMSPTEEVLEELFRISLTEVYLEQCRLNECFLEELRRKNPECSIKTM